MGIGGEMMTISFMMMNSCCTTCSTTTFTSCCLGRRRNTKPFSTASSSQHSHHVDHPFLLRVTNDRGRSTELSSFDSDKEYLISEADRFVDGLNFGELCNEFECISSPLVESTARQLVRDILELREGNRALGTFALSVQYKSVQEMSMLSTSVLSIKWTIKGKPKNIVGGLILGGDGDLTIRVNSQFTLNQISGQVTKHEEFWDLSASPVIAQSYFWTSRRLFATIESGKDLADAVKTLSSRFPTEKQDMDIFPDPSGDPTKFFQRDDGFQRDVYQIALFLALVYFVIQVLRTTL